MSCTWAKPAALLAGTRYERKVGKALSTLFPSAAICPQHPCGRGFVDFRVVQQPPLLDILVECKATLSATAFAQIARYVWNFPRPCIRAIICQKGGGCELPAGAELLSTLSALTLPSLTTSPLYIIPWTGRFPP